MRYAKFFCNVSFAAPLARNVHRSMIRKFDSKKCTPCIQLLNHGSDEDETGTIRRGLITRTTFVRGASLENQNSRCQVEKTGFRKNDIKNKISAPVMSFGEIKVISPKFMTGTEVLFQSGVHLNFRTVDRCVRSRRRVKRVWHQLNHTTCLRLFCGESGAS